MRAARALAAIALAAIACAPVRAQAPEDAFPGVANAYLVRIDGADRWAHAPDARLEPASLTKILTALLVVDALPGDRVVTVSAQAAAATGARIGLATGMKLAADDLLAAMMLRSANDACLALAEAVAGSEAAFVGRMNARARELGLAGSRFANACGFDAPGHRATARDLARLAELAMAHPRIAPVVARERAEIRARDGRVFRFDNTNALVGRVDGARGVKTGWTRRAGRCLVAWAERDGAQVLVVLLGAPDRWWDAVAMVEQAFEDARSRRTPARPPAKP